MPSTYTAENLLETQVTGINEYEILKDVVIYPNPMQDYFVVDFDSNKEQLLVVYNSIGENIYQEPVVNGTVINASSWSKGVYFIKIGDKNGSKVVK